jgi:hypothetical protein
VLLEDLEEVAGVEVGAQFRMLRRQVCIIFVKTFCISIMGRAVFPFRSRGCED